MKFFYLQDARGYVGNAMLFWRKENKGYTCDIGDAETYTAAALKAKHLRETDIPWRKEYIDERLMSCVDMQRCTRGDGVWDPDDEEVTNG